MLTTILLTLGAPLLLGTAIMRCLGITARTEPVAYAGWVWVTGSFAVAVFVFAWLWTGPDTSSAALPAAGMGLFATLGLWSARGRRPIATASVNPDQPERAAAAWERWVFRGALAFVLLVVLERILRGSLAGIVGTDEANFWAFRAKLLFETGGFGPAYLDAVRAYALGNADYPLLNPLLQLWAFVSAGEITHVWNRVPLQLFSLALVLVLAGALRRVARPAIAGGLVLLLAGMEPLWFGARLGYSDVPLAAGMVLAFDAALRWQGSGDSRWLVLASLAGTFALWTKHEGTLWLCVLVGAGALLLLLAGLRGRGRPSLAPRRGWLLCVPPALVLATTWAVNTWTGANNLFLSNSLRATYGSEDRPGNFVVNFFERFGERIGPTLTYFRRRVFLDPDHSQLVLTALLVAALGLLIARLPKRDAPDTTSVTALPGVLALAAATLLFIGLPKDLDYHLKTAASRVTFQLVPCALLWLGLASESGRRGLSFLILVLVLWRAPLAAWSAAGELVEHAPTTVPAAFVRSERERIDDEMRRRAANRETQPDLYPEIYSALLAEVPEDGLVYVFTDEELGGVVKTMRTLAFPRRFVLTVLPRRGGPSRERIAELLGDDWVLDLLGVPMLAELCEPLDVGAGWSLWRGRRATSEEED